jgi:hypothetical protein
MIRCRSTYLDEFCRSIEKLNLEKIMKLLTIVFLCFLNSLAAAAGIEGVWKGQGEAKQLTVKFLPGERWMSTLQPQVGIYVVEGSNVTMDKFLNQRVKGRLSNDLFVIVVDTPQRKDMRLQFERGNALDYQDATETDSIRPKIAEMTLSMSVCRTAIAESYSSALNPVADSAGCAVKTKFGVAKVVANGKIIFHVNNAIGMPGIDGRVITMTPLVDGKPARFLGRSLQVSDWRCGAKEDLPPGTAMVDPKYMPDRCKG